MMKPLIFFIFLFSFALSTELVDGIAAYTSRAEGSIGTKAQSKNIDEAIRQFEQAIKIDDIKEEAAVYLLKCYYYKGTYVLTDEEDRKAELG